MERVDLVLIHPPSVYDFRQKAILYGPISDLIPSSPVFEMYPLGFLTMTDYLESRGLRVRIINLALRMINDRSLDVPRFLRRLCPRAFGIDLHWLPHAHGAIEIARILKRCHPDIPIIVGGLSATYFHRELISYPEVDFVLRGDSVEPSLHQLMLSLGSDTSLGRVPNLTWKREDEVRVNPLGFVPAEIDYADIAPEKVVRMVLRHGDLQSVLPFNGWWQNPITAVFNVKGCAHHCLTCGGSHPANSLINFRQAPAFRTPHGLVKNILDISRISRGPIFLVGDLLQAGVDYAGEILSRLASLNIGNEIVFELFGMPPSGYLRSIDRSVRNWSLELSPESHDQEIRRLQDVTVFFSNAEMEAVIRQALSLRCHRLDVFFMIGLVRQTKVSVMETIGYCEQLFQSFDRRLSCFVAPMGPFLDPGSRCFEQSETCGYRLLAHTLEEHRQLLVQPTWKQILNYETDWMSREELVDATYDAAEALNALKLKYGRISRRRGRRVAKRIAQARDLEARLSTEGAGEPDPETLARLQGEIHSFSVSTVCDKQELFWRRPLLNFRWGKILRIACDEMLARSPLRLSGGGG